MTEQRYELVITGEAEVVPGPPRRIRELCEAALECGEQIDPQAILDILDTPTPPAPE